MGFNSGFKGLNHYYYDRIWPTLIILYTDWKRRCLLSQDWWLETAGRVRSNIPISPNLESDDLQSDLADGSLYVHIWRFWVTVMNWCSFAGTIGQWLYVLDVVPTFLTFYWWGGGSFTPMRFVCSRIIRKAVLDNTRTEQVSQQEAVVRG